MNTEGIASASEVERRYLAMAPEIQSRAWARHGHLSPADREDAVAETMAWSWAWCLSAGRRGKLGRLNPVTLSRYAARMYASGRRFAGSCSADALGEEARVKHRLRVRSLTCRDAAGDEDEVSGRRGLSEALVDSRHERPLEQCRVNTDYPFALLDPRLPARAKECFSSLLQDNGPGHVKRIAQTMGVTSARVCQLKLDLAGALSRIGYAPAGLRPSG